MTHPRESSRNFTQPRNPKGSGVLVALVALCLFAFQAAVAGTFPLPYPTRPTTFPLARATKVGSVVAWGLNDNGQTNVPTGLLAVSVAAGQLHTVALLPDGTVRAWGNNSFGQTSVPEGLQGVVAIQARANYTVALQRDGTVQTWGQEELRAPQNLQGVVGIAAGFSHAVALKSDGTVFAWGKNEADQLAVPAGLGDVVAIAAGFYHTLALKGDGTVVAWGNNSAGQATVPLGLNGVVAIAANNFNNFALKRDGTVVAWGSNDHGLNLTQGFQDVVGIAAGHAQAFVLLSNGMAVGWGYNSNGQTIIPPGLVSVFATAVGDFHTVALDPTRIPPRAEAKAEVVNGFVVALLVTSGGRGYEKPPTVLITGGGGTGATATAIVVEGVVTGFKVTNAGHDYTSVPLVRVASPPFAPEVSIAVSRVNVTMKISLGKKYQLQSSMDLKVWTVAEPDFVADSENITKEFIVAETGRFFRIVEVL